MKHLLNLDFRLYNKLFNPGFLKQLVIAQEKQDEKRSIVITKMFSNGEIATILFFSRE